jgi:hypothetical protein
MMQKVKDSDLTLYEEIEEIKKRRARQKDKGVSCPSCVSCKALTLCNNSDNYKTPYKTDMSQRCLVPVPVIVQESDQTTLEDRLMELYAVKIESIAGQYQDGGIEWIIQDRPELYQSLCQADRRIDKVWKAALAGSATVTDFEVAVDAWYELQLEGILLYRESLPKPEIKPEARQTIPACYACHESRWWIDYAGNRKCGVCHPPAAARLVKEWLPIVAHDPVPDAELISSSLQYLNGIDDDLSGWTLWERIEQGKEHRFAKDASGVVRWERWYSIGR